MANRARRNPSYDRDDPDVLIVDTGGGHYSTITTNAWLILSKTNHVTHMSGYQSGNHKVYPVVNGVTKATIEGRRDPVLFRINYATLVDDELENESLLQPWQAMSHGVSFDLTPFKYGGQQCMKVDDSTFPLEFNDETLQFSITKPTEEELENLDCIELTSPLLPEHLNKARRKRQKTTPEDIPMSEWRKRLAWASEDEIKKTLEATTQFYLSMDHENRENPRDHYQSRHPALKLPRQREGAATDTYFPSVVSSRGHTC